MATKPPRDTGGKYRDPRRRKIQGRSTVLYATASRPSQYGTPRESGFFNTPGPVRVVPSPYAAPIPVAVTADRGDVSAPSPTEENAAQTQQRASTTTRSVSKRRQRVTTSRLALSLSPSPRYLSLPSPGQLGRSPERHGRPVWPVRTVQLGWRQSQITDAPAVYRALAVKRSRRPGTPLTPHKVRGD